MSKFSSYIMLFLILKVEFSFSIDSYLTPSIDKEEKKTLSMMNCLASVITQYFEETEIITLSLTTVDGAAYSNYIVVDKILLEWLHSNQKWSIFIMKVSKRSECSVFLTKTHNYVIYLRNLPELNDQLKFLKCKIWYPRAKVVIFINVLNMDHDYFLKSVFRITWKMKILNVIVMLPNVQNSTVIEVFTRLPYANGACGEEFDHFVKLDECSEGKWQVGLDLFPNKIPKNLNGCSVRVRTVIWPPYVLPPEVPFNDNNNVTFTNGLEILMLNTLAKVANISIVYSLSEKIEDWGLLYNGYDATGLFGTVYSEEADLGISSLAATTNRYLYLDASTPYTTESLTWCVPSASLKPGWLNIFDIFQFTTWLYIFSTYILASFCIWLLSFSIIGESLVYKHLPSCFLYMFGAILSLSLKTKPKYSRVQLFLMIWIIFSFNLTSIYQTSLVSTLMNPSYQKQIKTVDEIFESRMKFGFLQPSSLYFNEPSNWKDRKIRDESLICNNTYKCLRDISQFKNYTLIIARLYLMYVARDFMNKQGIQLYWFKDNEVSFPVNIYTYKGYPLLGRINELITQITQSGLMDKWEDDVKNSLKKTHISEEESDSTQSLSLGHMGGAFFILLIGLLIAIISFSAELIKYKHSKKTSTIEDTSENK